MLQNYAEKSTHPTSRQPALSIPVIGAQQPSTRQPTNL